MNNLLAKKIEEIMKQYDDFMDFIIPETLYNQMIKESSNTIAQHLRCIIAGRVSMIECFSENKPFAWKVSVSFDELYDYPKLKRHLNESHQKLLDVLMKCELTLDQQEILFDMINHEYMHQGQLIRYLIYHDLGYPPTWDTKWYLSDD